MTRLIIFLFAVCLAWPAQADDKATLLKDNMDMAQALEDIAAPILSNNPDLCGDYTRFYIGAEFMTVDGVSGSYRDLVAEHYNVGDYPTVTILGQGSPAAAKLKHGDTIHAVNGADIQAGQAGQDTLMKAVGQGGALDIALMRNEQPAQVSVTPVKVCGAQVRLDPKDSNEIYLDKGNLYITKGAMRTQSDQALAAEIKAQLSRYKQ